MLVLAAGAVLVSGGTAGAACVAPSIEVAPDRAPAGSTVTLTGQGWTACQDVVTDPPQEPDPHDAVRIGFGQDDTSGYGDDVATPADDGSFSYDFVLPEGAADGGAVVLAMSEESGDFEARADMTIAEGRAGGRIAGADRIATSVEVSERAFADGAATAYLASARVPFDAQVGANLGGPILLVEPCGPINPRVLDELDRLGVTRVDVLGGPAAVADSVHQQALDGTYDGTVDDCPGAIPSEVDGVSFSFVEDGRVQVLTLANDGDRTIESGPGYVLERLVGGAYVWINEGAVFMLPAYVLQPGTGRELNRIDPDAVFLDAERDAQRLAPGTYRVRVDFRTDRAARSEGAVNRGTELAATFQVP